MSHYTLPEIHQLPEKSDQLRLDQLWQRAKSDIAAEDVSIEFSRDVIHKLVCPHCHKEVELFAPVGSVTYEAGRCPDDGHMRVVEVVHGFTGNESFGSRKLSDLGLPLFDVFTARSATHEIGYLINGDAPAVLGPLAKGSAPS